MASLARAPVVARLDPAKPILPEAGRRNVLVTSALPYVNNVPHLGNIIGCVLSADVYARFCRQRGDNVIFICGTDEYGTATETKALQEGLSPKEICDKYHALHRDVYQWFMCSFDRFGRTSAPEQTEVAQQVFRSLRANDFIHEESVTQLFCESCSRFLADRFIEGVCPNCSYDSARGDQCDNCGKLLNATELLKPACVVCRACPVPKESNHLFLDLDKISPKLEAWLKETMANGLWSSNAKAITQSWVDLGLRPRCITRDLKWGIPVPLEGYENKVFYVWFDAPIGYVSITKAYAGEDWKKWWLNAPDVELFQFMGKDNVPFHTVLFPSSLLGSGEPWTTLKGISTTEYLNFENAQFSKSRGVGVFGNHVQETGISVDTWRYYLLVNRPESSDTNFSWMDLYRKNNDELLANIGNFFNRSLKFLWTKYDGKLPQLGELTDAERSVLERVNALLGQFNEQMAHARLKEGLRIVTDMSHRGNEYLQETKAWVLFKEDRARCDTVVAFSIHLSYIIATTIAPFLPALASNVLHTLNLLTDDEKACSECHTLIPSELQVPLPFLSAGHAIREPEILVQKIDDDKLAYLRKRWGVKEANGAPAAQDDAAASKAGASGDKKAQKQKQQQPPHPKKEKKEKGKEARVVIKEAEPVKADIQAALAELKELKKDAVANKEQVDAVNEKLKGLQAKLKEINALHKPPPEPKKKSEKVPDQSVMELDLRVGRVIVVGNHPEADSLYVLKVDVGEENPRQICAGLKSHYKPDELEGKVVMVLCNLKAAKLRGELSEGMILAGSEGEVVAVTSPLGDAKPGEQVLVDGKSAPTGNKKLSKQAFEKHALAYVGGQVQLDGQPLRVGGQGIGIDASRNIADGSNVK